MHVYVFALQAALVAINKEAVDVRLALEIVDLICGHFRRLGDTEGDQSYALRRFDDEANRLFGVMNNRLYERPYLAGEEYTIADMACYPWTVAQQSHGQDLDAFRHVRRWQRELEARPGVQRGMASGSELSVDYASLTPGQIEQIKAVLYNQRARPAPDE